MNPTEIYNNLKVIDTAILVRWYNDTLVNPFEEGNPIREVNENGKRYAVQLTDRVAQFDTFSEFLDGMTDTERKGFLSYLLEYPEVLEEIAK